MPSGQPQQVHGGPLEVTGGADSLTENTKTHRERERDTQTQRQRAPGVLGFMVIELRSSTRSCSFTRVNPSRTTIQPVPMTNRVMLLPPSPKSIEALCQRQWQQRCRVGGQLLHLGTAGMFSGKDIQRNQKGSTCNSVFDSKEPSLAMELLRRAHKAPEKGASRTFRAQSASNQYMWRKPSSSAGEV